VRSGWLAYGSSDPLRIANRAEQEQISPAFRTAARLHLGRFPCLQTGLNLIERTTLELLRSSASPFHQLFRLFGSHPATIGYGLGDHQYARTLLDLAEADPAPISITGQSRVSAVWENPYSMTVALTRAGRDALDCRCRIRHTVPRWLGGVDLTISPWRVDETSGRLVRSNA
jgi:hypothetical protein